MENMETSIRIVEYNDSHAYGLSKMWRESRINWGGDLPKFSVEEIMKKERKATNLVSFVALDGDEVVGYTNGSRYFNDDTTMFLSFLNVRPDYLNKKIGKKLIQCLIDKAVELEKSRLVAYTWPGNTRVFSLYQNLGFTFKELNDGRILLENFIPKIKKVGLLKDYFMSSNIYEGMKLYKKEGMMVKGTTFYEYQWDVNGNPLRVQFEDKNKEISLLETKEFLLCLSLNSYNVMQGSTIECNIKIINKSETPLPIEIKSTDSNLSIEEKHEVICEINIYRDIKLQGIGKKNMLVNFDIGGRFCSLGCGVNVFSPINVNLNPVNALYSENEKINLEIMLENSTNETMLLEARIEDNNILEFLNKSIKITLKPKQKKYISAEATVKGYGYFITGVNLKYVIGGIIKEYKRTISTIISGLGQMFYFETEDSWNLHNGIYSLIINKKSLEIKTGRINDPCSVVIGTPILIDGQNSEILTRQISAAIISKKGNFLKIEVKFDSTTIIETSFSIFFSMFPEGLIKIWASSSGNKVKKSMLLFNFNFKKNHAFFPLDNKVVEFTDNKILNFSEINLKNLTENWFFCKSYEINSGLIWPKNCIVDTNEHLFEILYPIDNSNSPKTELNPIYLSIGLFNNWYEVSSFTNGKSSVYTEIYESEFLTHNYLLLENQDYHTMEIKSHKSEENTYNYKFIVNNREIEPVVSQGKLKIDRDTFNNPISLIQCHKNNGTSFDITNSLVIVPKGRVTPRIKKYGRDYKIYTLENGILKIKISPEYFPGVFSLEVNEREWIDSAFPEVIPKSWWNPWVGGMKISPSFVNLKELLQSQTIARFIKTKDNLNNTWTGIKLRTLLDRDSHTEPIYFEQFYITLPGVPILVTYSRNNYNLTNYINDAWSMNIFLKKDVEICYDNYNNPEKFIGGKEEIWLNHKDYSNIKLFGYPDRMYLVNSKSFSNKYIYTNQDVTQISSKYKNSLIKGSTDIETSFIIFDERYLHPSILNCFRNIKFQNNEQEVML